MYTILCPRCDYKWLYKGTHWRAQCPRCHQYVKTPHDPLKNKIMEWMILPDTIIRVAEKLHIEMSPDMLYLLIGIGQDGLTAEIPDCRNTDTNVDHIATIMSRNIDMLNKHPPKVKEELIRSLLQIYRKEISEFGWSDASSQES